MRADAEAQLVAEVIWLHPVGGQLVHTRPRRADRHTQSVLKVERRARVVAVCEHDLADLAAIEPLQALRRRDRVDEDAFLHEVVRAGLQPRARMARRPMQDTRQDLVDALGQGGHYDNRCRSSSRREAVERRASLGSRPDPAALLHVSGGRLDTPACRIAASDDKQWPITPLLRGARCSTRGHISLVAAGAIWLRP